MEAWIIRALIEKVFISLEKAEYHVQYLGDEIARAQKQVQVLREAFQKRKSEKPYPTE